MRYRTIKNIKKKRKIGGGNFLSNPIKESIDSLRNHLDSNVKVPTGSRSSPGKRNIPDILMNEVVTASPAVTLPSYLTRKERKNPANRRIKGGGNTPSESIKHSSYDIENQKHRPLKSKFFTRSPFSDSSSSSSSESSSSLGSTESFKDTPEVKSLIEKMSQGVHNVFGIGNLNKTKKSIDNMTDQVAKLHKDLKDADVKEFEEREKVGLTFGGKRRKLRKRRRTRKRGGDELYMSSGDIARRPVQQVASRRSPTPLEASKAAYIASNKITGPVEKKKRTMGKHYDFSSGFKQDGNRAIVGGKKRRTRKNRRLGGTTPPAKEVKPPSISPTRPEDKRTNNAPQYPDGHGPNMNLMGAFNAVA